jgi:hypothetical protein
MEVFLFVLFGCVLKAAGALDLFMKVGMLVANKFRSGPAQAAVISSALMGMVSGTIAANVATTGAFTIPAMIKRGFRREYAGAVEACSSTGGQIMPPVMGVAAFLMAGLTGISYAVIAVAAFLPAPGWSQHPFQNVPDVLFVSEFCRLPPVIHSQFCFSVPFNHDLIKFADNNLGDIFRTRTREKRFQRTVAQQVIDNILNQGNDCRFG